MAKFSLMQKTINLEQIEGKYSAFAKCPYALPVKLSKPLAKDGYGSIKVDGVELSEGKQFYMDSIVKMHCMLVPVGEVAKDFDKEYTISFSGFVAEDGSHFRNQSFRFKTLPRRRRDDNYTKHDEVALRVAKEGMALLENHENVLPLPGKAILNCFGAAQFIFRNTATGAGLINPRWQADFHQSIREHSNFQINEEISRMYRSLKDIVPTREELLRAAEKSDVALIFISRTSGEFLDNKPVAGGYYLTDDEEKMIAAVSQVFAKTIAIINTGYPIDMRWMETYHIKGAIYTGFSGMMAGYALMELLDGRENPSGHLPDTWALDYYDYPSAKNFINFKEDDEVPGEKSHGVRIVYEEDIYVGYRYFDSFHKDVKYPFGHGLSYTSFSFSCSGVTLENDEIKLQVSVTNTGNCEGKAVAQVYIGLPLGQVEKPERVLVGFDKTKTLKAGETQDLMFQIKDKYYASFSEKENAYVLERGTYRVWIGDSISNAKEVDSFSLAKDKMLKKVIPVAHPVEQFHRMTRQNPFVNTSSKIVPLEERFAVRAEKETFHPTPVKGTGKRIQFPQLVKQPELLDEFVSGFTVDELCKLNVSTGADWYLPWGNGTAGGTPAFRKYRMPKLRVSDGNTGLNIVKPNVGFPSSCTVAATFNKQLAETVGLVIGEESKENEIAVNLGPGMNLHRNILCGRHPEYFSEDPILAGVMAGYHGKGIEEAGVCSTYKHLFCNNSETSRKGSQSIVSQQALRELYFKVFEVAFDINKPSCVMTSYNALNGIYPAESTEILQTLVKEEWGFDGLIMTDWCAYDTIDPVEIVKAGTGWLTEGGRKYVSILKKAYKEGKISEEILRDNAKQVVKLVLKHVRRRENDKTGV